jgi:hypothetical protein
MVMAIVFQSIEGIVASTSDPDGRLAGCNSDATELPEIKLRYRRLLLWGGLLA